MLRKAMPKGANTSTYWKVSGLVHDDKSETIRTSFQADVLLKGKRSTRGSKMNHSQEVVLLNSFNNTRKNIIVLKSCMGSSKGYFGWDFVVFINQTFFPNCVFF